MKWIALALALALVGSISCKAMGCFSLKDACYECCKEKCKMLKGHLGSKAAWEAREPCTDECIEHAEAKGKDAYWVEKHQACLFDY